MKKAVKSGILAFSLLALATAGLHAEYSPWTFFGGLNLLYNSDGEDLNDIPGMQEDGSPGGLGSAPSPIAGFVGAEYRLRLPNGLIFAPSASLYSTQYLWSGERALPTEIENRTAYAPALLLDAAFLYTITRDRFLFSFGGGPALAVRYAFLASGVDADAQNPGESLPAGEQVQAVNSYLWGSARWLYPTLQAGVRYELATGWGGGLTLRAGIPIFNIWSEPSVSFMDSFMFMAALTITPPISKKPSEPDTQ